MRLLDIPCASWTVVDSYQSNPVLILYIATVQLFKHLPSLGLCLRLHTSLNQFPFGTYIIFFNSKGSSLPTSQVKCFTLVRSSCVPICIGDTGRLHGKNPRRESAQAVQVFAVMIFHTVFLIHMTYDCNW